MNDHKKWADLHSIISIILVVGLSLIASMIADFSRADEGMRISLIVMMNAIVIVVSVWQAAGMALTRFEHLINMQGNE